jgi:hypothetical protein
MATEVILKDEATRRAVEYALWLHAAMTVEGTLHEEFWAAADEVVGVVEIDDGATASSELADARLNAAVLARADVDRVRDAEIGERLVLEIPVSVLAERLADCKEAVDLAPQLTTYAAKNQKVRDLTVASGEAAVALLAVLGMTGAVA